MSKRSSRRRCGTILAAAILGFGARDASAATTYQWAIPIGGAWSTPCNWTPSSPAGPPGAADTAQFNIANTYTVTLNVSPTITTFMTGGSNLTLGNSTVGRTISLDHDVPQ